MLKLQKCIRKIMHWSADDNIHMGYNHVVAMRNYYQVQQEPLQTIQEYHDQFTGNRKVCERLGLKSRNGESNKKMNINNPTEQQKAETENNEVEEHHAILFLIGADKYKYG